MAVPTVLLPVPFSPTKTVTPDSNGTVRLWIPLKPDTCTADILMKAFFIAGQRLA